MDGVPLHDMLNDHQLSRSSLPDNSGVFLFFPLLILESLVGLCLRDRKAVI